MIEKTPTDKIVINIDGEKGNAFSLLGDAKNLAQQLGMNYHTILDEMTQGDYITLQTSNAEYLDAFGSMWTVK